MIIFKAWNKPIKGFKQERSEYTTETSFNSIRRQKVLIKLSQKSLIKKNDLTVYV